jgi:glycosyltransferase involved in cell wall biosynthesis
LTANGTAEMDREPLVSVVTPFYNTAEYLAACIESVLGQSYRNFEYLLVNNKSTDGSRAIAERYAARDPRIRLIDNATFVSQIDNYNGALTHVSADAKYVKIVQADDSIFPECLVQMVGVGEREPTVGLVSSYYLNGETLSGAGVPHGTSRVAGRDACRLMLLGGFFLVGSPTCVLYRADVVRARRPFFPVGRYHSDTDVAYEILIGHDLGFVHQVLSFMRADNYGITNSTRDFNPDFLDFYMVVERFGASVLTPDELDRLRTHIREVYFGFLGRALLRLKGRRFWSYHRAGLATLGRDVPWLEVARHGAAELARLVLNPESTVREAVADIRRRRTRAKGRVPMPFEKS